MTEIGIGAAARRTGIATSAIRYYEKQGLLPRAARRAGRRVYDESVVDRLAVIRLAKAAGFTLREIRRLLGGFARSAAPGQRWRALAGDKLAALDRRIAEAERMKRVLGRLAACRCASLDDCGRAARAQG
jgi:MerR family redox-sensitive transcriptional activator SoxR